MMNIRHWFYSSLMTVFAAMQFIFGPVIGALSDRFGRRPVLLVSLLIMALDYLVMALAQTFWLLLAGRIVGGITAATVVVGNTVRMLARPTKRPPASV